MHPFTHDFYGHEMSVLVLGYIRPELDYVSKGTSSLRKGDDKSVADLDDVIRCFGG